MAQIAVRIYGVENTKKAMGLVMKKIRMDIPKALKKTGKETVKMAQRLCPVDTGALQYSIHTKTIKKGPNVFQENAKAGHPDIKRGVGKFIYSTKTGRKVPERITTAYAEDVEKERKFMETSRHWADKKAFSNLLGMVISIVRTTI